MRVVVIKPDNTFAWAYADFSDIQRMCGGAIQPVSLGGQYHAYVSEDGIGLGQPDNELATKLVACLGNNVYYDRAIRGTMVLVGEHGCTRDAPDGATALLENLRKAILI